MPPSIAASPPTTLTTANDVRQTRRQWKTIKGFLREGLTEQDIVRKVRLYKDLEGTGYLEKMRTLAPIPEGSLPAYIQGIAEDMQLQAPDAGTPITAGIAEVPHLNDAPEPPHSDEPHRPSSPYNIYEPPQTNATHDVAHSGAARRHARLGPSAGPSMDPETQVEQARKQTKTLSQRKIPPQCGAGENCKNCKKGWVKKRAWAKHYMASWQGTVACCPGCNTLFNTHDSESTDHIWDCTLATYLTVASPTLAETE